jgi:hypothetical protein
MHCWRMLTSPVLQQAAWQVCVGPLSFCLCLRSTVWLGVHAALSASLETWASQGRAAV